MSFIIKNFELLSERPEHAQELKKFILELAVRGKLNLSDEPASKLLEKIREEKRKELH